MIAVNRRCRPDLPVCTFLRGRFSVFALHFVGAGAEMALGAVFFRLCKLGELWYNRENYKNHEGLV